jgi:hypothetical protein
LERNRAWRRKPGNRCGQSIPQHFGTFPGITQNADGFAAELKKLKIDFYEMKPGETISFRGKQLVKSN